MVLKLSFVCMEGGIKIICIPCNQRIKSQKHKKQKSLIVKIRTRVTIIPQRRRQIEKGRRRKKRSIFGSEENILYRMSECARMDEKQLLMFHCPTRQMITFHDCVCERRQVFNVVKHEINERARIYDKSGNLHYNFCLLLYCFFQIYV